MYLFCIIQLYVLQCDAQKLSVILVVFVFPRMWIDTKLESICLLTQLSNVDDSLSIQHNDTFDFSIFIPQKFTAIQNGTNGFDKYKYQCRMELITCPSCRIQVAIEWVVFINTVFRASLCHNPLSQSACTLCSNSDVALVRSPSANEHCVTFVVFSFISTAYTVIWTSRPPATNRQLIANVWTTCNFTSHHTTKVFMVNKHAVKSVNIAVELECLQSNTRMMQAQQGHLLWSTFRRVGEHEAIDWYIIYI